MTRENTRLRLVVLSIVLLLVGRGQEARAFSAISDCPTRAVIGNASSELVSTGTRIRARTWRLIPMGEGTYRLEVDHLGVGGGEAHIIVHAPTWEAAIRRVERIGRCNHRP